MWLFSQIRRCRRHQLLEQSRESAEDTPSKLRFLGGGGSLIPESNGDNKYTQNMVPGYTGKHGDFIYKMVMCYVGQMTQKN
jgi:hypothetical protein